MENHPSESESYPFPLVECGLNHFLADWFHSSHFSLRLRLIRVAILIVLTWIPILMISLLAGHAFKGIVDVPLLHDPAMYGRYLFVLPVLELAEVVVAISLVVQVNHFVESEIVSQQDRPQFGAAVRDVIRVRTSVYSEMGLVILAWVISLTMRLVVMKHEGSSWDRLGSQITLAGWWYTLVSFPVLLFFVLRWLFIFGLWSWFLFRVSRLDLRLTPTHPDHAGGLGFLGWGLASFSSVIMAVSAVFSAGFAYQILHRHESLDSLKFHIIVFVVITLIVLHTPLLAFSGRLSRFRFRGLLEYSTLVLQHDRAFDEKWIEHPKHDPNDPLLGSADIQSLADIATVYDHVNDMRLMPFDTKAFAVLVASAVLPMIPLVATEVPLQEILSKLLELIA